MCDERGSTREHVPPLSFFPEDRRRNLWTVRACSEHNNDNALDVEYVRNSIVADMQSFGGALSAAQNRMIASFLHSPGLYNQTFRELTELEHRGQELITWRNDIERFDRVMKAIAYGVYYKLFKKRMNKNWKIFYASMKTPLSVQGEPDGYEEMRQVTQYMDLTHVKTPEPSVFRCFYQMWEEDQVFFCFVFYLGYEIHALSVE